MKVMLQIGFKMALNRWPERGHEDTALRKGILTLCQATGGLWRRIRPSDTHFRGTTPKSVPLAGARDFCI